MELFLILDSLWSIAAKKKSKFDNKFKSTAASESRTANVRDERKVKDEQRIILSFIYSFRQISPIYINRYRLLQKKVGYIIA